MKQGKFTVPIKGHTIHFRKAKNSPFWKVNLDRFGMGRRSTGKRDRSDAVRKVMDWFEEKKPKSAKTDKAALETLCNSYLSYLKTGKSASGHVRAKHVLNTLFLPFINGRPVTHDIMRDWIAARLEGALAEDAEAVTKETVNRDLNTIRAMYNQAVQEKKIPGSPINGISNLDVPDLLPKPYERTELNIILDASPELWRMIWLVFLNTGARLGDARLKWTDIRQRVHFYDTKEGTERVVPQTDELRKVLPRLRVLLEKEGRLNEYVVPYCKSWITHKFGKIAKACGVGGNLHRLRHSFGTHLLASGVDIKTVSELMGHKDIRTTMKYVKALDKQKEAAMKGLSFQSTPIIYLSDD